jgi:hypothetical protein
MTADEIAADLKDYASRKKKVNDLYEAAMKNPDVLPKGITTDQLRLAVKGDPVTGQRVPPNFSVKNGKLSTDINQAKKQFADFQADLKKIFDEEGITDAKVVQLGSGTSGWSTAPGKIGKPWSPKSDVDFAIFSDEALAQAKRQGAGINPKNMQEGLKVWRGETAAQEYKKSDFFLRGGQEQIFAQRGAIGNPQPKLTNWPDL